jgi:predicted amidohydrolase
MGRRVGTLLLSICLGAGAVGGSPSDGPASRIDLMAELAPWSGWAHRPEIAPFFRAEPEPGSQTRLVIETPNNDVACGCWRRALPTLQKGRRYMLEAAFQAERVDSIGHSVWALLARGDREFLELTHQGTRDGRHLMQLALEPDEDWSGLRLCLYLAWSPRSLVRWSHVYLMDVTDQPHTPRIVRLAAVSGGPTAPQSPQDCLDFYCRRLDEIGRQGVDLVCLPEVINTSGLKGDTTRFAEPIPGDSTARLAAQARQHRMYVAASLSERDGPCRYNTGVLIDRAGQIVGQYRKTHLTISEALLQGKTPGDMYPVFETDFGRVGYMICYDNHFPEVARALAIQGADVLVFSNMGDGREEGILWEPYIRTRALDNQVHIVAAVNGGRSCIVSPRGELLSIVDKTPGAIASARCDLDTTVRNYSGRPIGKRYLQVRRADTFEILRHEYRAAPEETPTKRQEP